MARWNIDVPVSKYVQGVGPAAPDTVETASIESVVRALEDQKMIAIDTETTGLSNVSDYPLYWSVSWGKERVALHASTLPHFKHVLADTSKTWLLANAKFDMHMLANYGTPIQGKVHCIQVMHALLFAEESHKLKDMANDLLGNKWTDFQNTFGKISKKKGVTAEDVIRRAEVQDMPLLVEYACLDAWGTMELYYILKKMLEKELTYSLYPDTWPYIVTLWDYFARVEAVYTRVLWDQERVGIKIDMERVNDISPTIKKGLDNAEREVWRLAGRKLSTDSPDQLREKFFGPKERGNFGLKPLKKTKGGKKGEPKASTDAEVLQRIAEGNYPREARELAGAILDYRDFAKMYKTYIVGIGRYVDARDRIHTTYNQDIARTGRLSSKEPNLQNIPNPEKDTRWRIRSVFIAREGYTLIVVDYKQLEMRLLACAANDPDMQGVFHRNWDIHMGNASLMYGVPYDDIVLAKKTRKAVDAKELEESALTEYMVECLGYRNDVKNIGFGQPASQAEVKPAQNGETYGRNAYGNPVLPSVMGSVSTWGPTPPQQKGLAQGSHSPCFC